jgi:hypothetical protein
MGTKLVILLTGNYVIYGWVVSVVDFDFMKFRKQIASEIHTHTDILIPYTARSTRRTINSMALVQDGL